MTPFSPDALQVVADIASVAIALAALLRTAWVESRSRELTEQQLEISRRLVRPLIGVFTENFLSFVAVEIRNNGSGTAVITSVHLEKNNKQATTIAELVNRSLKNQLVAVDKYWVFPGGEVHLPAAGSLTLFRLSIETLMDGRRTGHEADQLLERTKEALCEICITVRYSDILDTEQPSVVVKLKL